MEMTVKEELIYVFSVNAKDAYIEYSSFVFQVHTIKWNVSLTNMSTDCAPARGCSTYGSHIGMVQLLSVRQHRPFKFSVDHKCSPGNCSNGTQNILVAVVGIPVYSEFLLCS